MRFRTSINLMGQIYIPKKIREAIGLDLKNRNEIILIGNSQSLFMIPPELSSEEALNSLEVISAHLKHDIKRRKTRI